MPAAASAAVVCAKPLLCIAGQDRPELSDQLFALAVREDALGLYRCEAELGNWGAVNGRIGFRHFGRDLFDFGKRLQVKSDGAVLFDGRIMGLRAAFPESASPRILVLADDRLQDLRMTRRTRTFAGVADADVVRAIASDHGLTPDVDVTGPTHAVLAQVNQSDLAFLRERALAIDAEVWVDGDTLGVKRRSRPHGAAVTLTWRKELREIQLTADLAGQRTAVTVSGWDVAAKEAIRSEATDAAIASEVGGDSSGVSILAALGERRENVAHGAPATAAEAQAAADAFFRYGARRFVTGHGVAELGAGLRVGRCVELKDLGPLFTGRYVVTAVRHRFDTSCGGRTEFEVERAGLGPVR